MREFTKENQRKFWNAIVADDDLLFERGFINPATLEVVIVGDVKTIHRNFGEDDFIEASNARSRVENSPQDWIEIPKLRPEFLPDEVKLEPWTNAELVAHANQFFVESGVDVNVG
ncbi:hypothetical protein BH10PLA1_BH10PLA1_23180 [soil metagenome]